MMMITMGNISAIRRPALSEVSVTSLLTLANRAVSCGSRTNARTTRIPVICSRRTRFNPSIRSCITRNCGTICEITIPIQIVSNGILTSRIDDSPTSTRSAMMVPPIAVIGAAISKVHVINTIICTCCTSLVMRVMSDGAPIAPTSRAENAPTWWKSAPLTSRPNPIATREPK